MPVVFKVRMLLNTLRPTHLGRQKIKHLRPILRERVPVAQTAADLKRLEATLTEQMSEPKADHS